MDKKGDAPTFFLILVALLLVIVAWFAFLSFDGNLQNKSGKISEILSDIGFFENYIVKESEIIGREVIIKKISDEEEALKTDFIKEFEKRNLGISGIENYYGNITRGEFKFVHEGGEYRFEIRDLFIESSRGANKMKRIFGFSILFDFNGEIKKSGVQNLNEGLFDYNLK